MENFRHPQWPPLVFHSGRDYFIFPLPHHRLLLDVRESVLWRQHFYCTWVFRFILEWNYFSNFNLSSESFLCGIPPILSTLAIFGPSHQMSSVANSVVHVLNKLKRSGRDRRTGRMVINFCTFGFLTNNFLFFRYSNSPCKSFKSPSTCQECDSLISITTSYGPWSHQ